MRLLYVLLLMLVGMLTLTGHPRNEATAAPPATLEPSAADTARLAATPWMLTRLPVRGAYRVEWRGRRAWLFHRRSYAALNHEGFFTGLSPTVAQRLIRTAYPDGHKVPSAHPRRT